MNAKLMPLTPKTNERSQYGTTLVRDWLVSASKKISDQKIQTASLDSELILAHVLKQNRAYLHAHDDKLLTKSQIKKADKLLNNRCTYLPIAYILGLKEFYGRDFIVNQNVLIPRPESEDVIDILKNINPSGRLIDVGSGSGCLGITAKLEFPKIQIELVDISKKALNIATKNAENLKAQVTITHGNLLSKISYRPNIIIANLPYVDKKWKISIETKFEPQLALFAADEGMQLIKKLFVQSTNIQQKDDSIIIEADPCQHQQLTEFAKLTGYRLVETKNYILLFSKT